MQATPTLTTAVLGSSTATTQTPADNSTKVATTAYVDNAILGQRQKEAVKYASIAALPTVVYANGSSGVGATLTAVALAAIALDSGAPAVADRVLIKNQVSDFQNGIYVVTATGSVGAVFVLTRATDFDQASDIQTGDTLFVTAGTTLANTTWTYNGIDSPTMGTTSLTFVQAAGPGSYTQGNGITITGVSIAIDTSVTVDKTTAQALSNKTLTAPIINGLTSASGNMDFSGSSGTFLTSTGANTLSGAVTIADATTPSLTTASGKTNTGFVQINGKTSGALKILPVDAAAQTVTLSLAAQTTGAATLTIPDMANTNKTIAWLQSPSFTTPALGVATATSINGNIFTTGSSTYTGTAAQTYTFPTTSATIARTDAANTFTGIQTITNLTLPVGGQILLNVPTADPSATGPTTSSFNSGYTSTAIGDLVYLDSSATWQKTDADAASTASNMLGICLSVASSGNPVLVALPGSFVYATAFITFTVGAPVYVGETAGAMQTAIPTGADNVIRVVGFGVHADKIFFMPSSDNQTTVA